MRYNATQAQQAAWERRFGCRLVGFVPCVGSDPRDIVHWSAAERHWNGGTVFVRLCDLSGSWRPLPNRTVDCMTCLTRFNNLFVEEPT